MHASIHNTIQCVWNVMYFNRTCSIFMNALWKHSYVFVCVCVFDVLFRLSDIYPGLISWTLSAETLPGLIKGNTTDSEIACY